MWRGSWLQLPYYLVGWLLMWEGRKFFVSMNCWLLTFVSWPKWNIVWKGDRPSENKTLSLTVMATITGTFSDTHRPTHELKAENALFLTGLIARMRGQYEDRKESPRYFICAQIPQWKKIETIGSFVKNGTEKTNSNSHRWFLYQVAHIKVLCHNNHCSQEVYNVGALWH